MEIVKSLTGGVTFWYHAQTRKTLPRRSATIEGSLAYALPQMGIFAPSISGLVGYTEDSTTAMASTVLTTITSIGTPV